MKINSLVSTFSKTFFGLSLLTGTLLAEHDGHSSEQKQVIVGERALSHLERLKTQERRARLYQQFAVDEEIDDASFSADEEEDATSDEDEENPRTEKTLKALNKKADKKWIAFSTSHDGAIHYTPYISPLGDYIELEDGSVWQVKSDQRHCILDWWTDERLIIVPNKSWFSSYYYCIVNLDREITVEVQLAKAPCPSESCTLRVIDLNCTKGEVALSDGSIWQVASSTLRHWVINDVVIIGINNGFFSSTCPNILINVNENDYVIANCVY